MYSKLLYMQGMTILLLSILTTATLRLATSPTTTTTSAYADGAPAKVNIILYLRYLRTKLIVHLCIHMAVCVAQKFKGKMLRFLKQIIHMYVHCYHYWLQ